MLLITSMIMFLGARAGRVWGLDGLILRKVSPSSRRWLSIIMVLTVFSALATLCRYRLSSLPSPLQSSITKPQGRVPT